MIGVLAAAAEPERFARLVLVGPSPRYIDDDGYVGGFSREDIEGLLDSLDSNYLGWSSAMAPVIMGNGDRPELGEELTEQLLPRRPGDRRATSRASTFLSDNRADLARVRTPEPRPAVLRRRHRARRPSASTSHAQPARQHARPARGHRPLPEPQRAGGDRRRDQGVPRGVTDDAGAPRGDGRGPLRGRALRLPVDAARRHDRAGQPHVRGAGPASRATSCSGAGASRTCWRRGGRIYHETHYAPLLRMQGCGARDRPGDRARRRVAPAGARELGPASTDASGRPRVIRTTRLRRHRPAPLRAGAAAGARGASRRSPSICSAACCPASFPPTDGLEVEVAYRPAVRGLEVGGDWYDAFWLDDGESVGFVVGDVVGPRHRGRGDDGAAAQRAARARLHRPRPGPLLDALDGYARRHGVGQMTTLAYAELHLGRGACASPAPGHPPPVLATPGARARAAVGGPLAAARRAPARGAARRGDADPAAGAARPALHRRPHRAARPVAVGRPRPAARRGGRPATTRRRPRWRRRWCARCTTPGTPTTSACSPCGSASRAAASRTRTRAPVRARAVARPRWEDGSHDLHRDGGPG